ncbi:PREDICTED: uncharacterized protein LOC104281964, partial [Charadrius vociferus]|uniref:uncharacterized protein LOC104281964 n=1 Tax=Charadrius vociferus TaxID=50402 RepID=UPI0005215844
VPRPLGSPDVPIPPLHRHWLAGAYPQFAVPYFIYDVYAMFLCHWHRGRVKGHEVAPPPSLRAAAGAYLRKDFLMVLHHAAMVLVCFPVATLWRQGKGDFFLGCLLMAELSTPFVCLGKVLILYQRQHTALHKLNGVALLLTFLLCRVLLFPYLYWAYGRHRGLPTNWFPLAPPSTEGVPRPTQGLSPELRWPSWWLLLGGLRVALTPREGLEGHRGVTEEKTSPMGTAQPGGDTHRGRRSREGEGGGDGVVKGHLKVETTSGVPVPPSPKALRGLLSQSGGPVGMVGGTQDHPTMENVHLLAGGPLGRTLKFSRTWLLQSSPVTTIDLQGEICSSMDICGPLVEICSIVDLQGEICSSVDICGPLVEICSIVDLQGEICSSVDICGPLVEICSIVDLQGEICSSMDICGSLVEICSTVDLCGL